LSTATARSTAEIRHKAPRPARDGWQIALFVIMAAWSALFATLALRLHAGMRTHKADLGQVAQAVWNSSRGRFVEQTDNGFLATRLTDHVEPILALISPVLWVWEDTRALLLLQVLAVAVGAWFVYDLALLRTGRVLAPGEWGQIWRRDPLLAQARPLAFALAMAWLLAPQLQSAVLTEFHAVPFAAPLILWALWAVEVRRWGHFAAAALLTAAVKEETALLAALLGLWAIWRAWGMVREARKAPQAEQAAHAAPLHPNARAFARPILPGFWWGAAVAAISLVWFALATFVIVPRFAADLYGVAESGYFARYGALGDSPLDILRSFFTQPALVWQILTEPARLRYLLGLVAPFALLPLLAPEILLLAAPVLLANVLSAYPAQYYGEFHYSAPVMPYVAAAAAVGLGRLWGWIWRRTEGASPAFQHLPAANAGAMAAAAVMHNSSTAVRPLLTLALLLWIGGWAVGSHVLFGRGPGGGRYDPTPITAHHALLPALVAQLPPDAAVTATAAVHPHLAMRRFLYQFPLGLETPPGSEAATWALLDVTTNTDMAPGDLLTRVEEMLAGGWSVVDARDGFLLLHKSDDEGSGLDAIPAPFYSFTEPAGEVEPLPAAQDWPRWRQTRLAAEWPADAEPRLDLMTPAGETVYTLGTSTPPALLWRAQGRAAGTLPAAAPQAAVTPALTLPRTVLAHTGDPSSGLVVRRTRGDRLATLPAAALAQEAYGEAIHALTGFELQPHEVTLPGAQPLDATIWLEQRTLWPGDTLEVWTQWRGAEWPADAPPRLELHHAGIPVAWETGAPRLFGSDQTANLAELGFANEWRSLILPAELPAEGGWALHLIAADGRPLATFPLRVRPFVADQTCALVGGPACLSQPE
jgi:uncharacterized membrane protein